jgi:chromosome segregation ATPase
MPWQHALETLIEMIEEVQHALNDPEICRERYRLLTAKRDALTEARMRIRDGTSDSLWIFRDLARN